MERDQNATDFGELELTHQLFHNLIREAHVGIVVLSGKEMIVTIVNAAYGHMIGRTVAELQGKPLFEIIPEAEEPFRKLLDHVRTTGKPMYIHEQHYRVHKNGEDLEGFLDVVYQPYKEVNGTITGVMALCHNVTEQKRFAELLAKQVRERTIELQRSNEDLQQFAHVISHDLQEPIRKIKMFANRIQQELGDGVSDNELIFLGKIHKAASRMSDMVEGVLTYSSLGAGVEAIEHIDLNELVKSIEFDLELPIKEKSASIFHGRLPVIAGAPILFYQLFYNLINNALKFGRKNVAPAIAITSMRVQEGTTHFVRIEVTDNGVGFDQEHAQQIFNPFTRLHSKDAFEGTGLGLALCKKIVERYGGRIGAIGRPGEGATIFIELPV